MGCLHGRIEAEIRRLGRLRIHAAEVRRRLHPVAAELGLPVPGYTTVLELVQSVRPAVIRRPFESGVGGAILTGRAPTLAEVEATRARALVHKDEILRAVALELEERRWVQQRDPGG